MKNKNMTYFLGIIVALVWGIIIYRLINAAGGNDDDPAPVASNKISKEPYNDFEVFKDTTRLLLNYRDPFGLVKQKDTITHYLRKEVSPKMTSPMAMPAPAFNWAFIKYAGYIVNPDTKKTVTMISVNGQNLTLSEGETKAQVKLIRNLRDSIKVSFGGKTKFISLK